MNSVVDKDRNGYLTPEEASGFLDDAQMLFYNKCKMQDFEYSEEALRPFAKRISLTSDSAGLITPPSDYSDINEVYRVVNNQRTLVEQVKPNELSYRLGSAIEPVSYFNPICIALNNGIQLYPNQGNAIELYYTAKPGKPVIGYTNSGVNGIAYNPATSTQLDFENTHWTQIMIYALAFAGVNLDNPGVTTLLGLDGNN